MLFTSQSPAMISVRNPFFSTSSTCLSAAAWRDDPVRTGLTTDAAQQQRWFGQLTYRVSKMLITHNIRMGGRLTTGGNPAEPSVSYVVVSTGMTGLGLAAVDTDS